MRIGRLRAKSERPRTGPAPTRGVLVPLGLVRCLTDRALSCWPAGPPRKSNQEPKRKATTPRNGQR